ncbi:MAG: hypothetical protein EOO77_16830 [Oxalobacteraceae bacterium]|nr:MAG: hypothetical protein EOO77_16830 [Oxalobacteraceae bacterium]
MRPFIITAVALTLAAVFLVSRLWNPVELGPDLANSQAFFGCYGSQAEGIAVNSTNVVVRSQNESTKIKRYLLLKRDAVINTVNNLRLDASGKKLSIGDADTGFFYKFNSDTKPTAIIIPDDSGVERILPRIHC